VLALEGQGGLRAAKAGGILVTQARKRGAAIRSMTTEHSITITAMNRPHLFRAMLESLVANDLTEWRVVIRVEPGEHAAAFAPIAAELLAGVPYDLKVNDEVQGIALNPFLAVETAFEAGSKLNLYLEEDLLVSPDATALALWYKRNHQAGWLGLSLLAGPCGSAGFLSNEHHPELLFEARTFNSIGFVMRRDEWYAHARAVWQSRPGISPIIHGNWRLNWGWDWSLYGLVAADPTLRAVQPVLARATHNGRLGGTYASPEFHDAAFGELPLNHRAEVDYRLTKVENLPRDIRSHVVLQDEITGMRMQMEDIALGRTGQLSTVPPVSRRR